MIKRTEDGTKIFTFSAYLKGQRGLIRCHFSKNGLKWSFFICRLKEATWRLKELTADQVSRRDPDRWWCSCITLEINRGFLALVESCPWMEICSLRTARYLFIKISPPLCSESSERDFDVWCLRLNIACRRSEPAMQSYIQLSCE